MRRIYFSFHYDRDIFRVSTVRNSWRFRPGNTTQPFVDKAEWEAVERSGRNSIESWISRQMNGTSVTVVLIGAQTSQRDWVIHEIKETYNRGNGLIGVYVHNAKNSSGNTDTKGANPFDNVWINYPNGVRKYFSEIYPTYDWVLDDGRNNLERWIETAAIKAGK